MLRCTGAFDGGEIRRDIKCVAVGDSGTGKTCLLTSYAQNTFSPDHVTTVFDNLNSIVLVDANAVSLFLWDTAGQEEYSMLRPLSYRDTDVFLVLFSLINKVSYENVQKKWVPELRHSAGNVPIVLVGTMLDMREDKQFILNHPDLEPLSTAQGEKLKTLLAAVAYVECSAKKQHDVEEVFNSAMKAALCKPKPKKSTLEQCKCSIM